MTKDIFKLIVVLMIICGSVSAQDKKSELLFKAMQDELVRNMKGLSIPGMERPFFIEYSITEGHSLMMAATLGSLYYSSENPISRGISIKVLVGDYHRTNALRYENRRYPGQGSASTSTTIDDNYGQIRRDLWRQTDVAYKYAAEEYIRKTTAMKTKSLSPEDTVLDDFTKVDPVNKIISSNNIVVDKTSLGHMIEELSAVFKDYPDIEASEVMTSVSSNDVYIVNSENSKYNIPNNMLTIDVSAACRADGKITMDKMSVCALQQKDLPTLDELKSQCKAFADKLIALKNAQAIKDNYSGPVLFEGTAVSSIFEKELFSGTGVYATREPVQGSGSPTLQDNMDSKVISNEFTVKSLPFLKEYDGKKLIGNFEMDVDGIVPEKELTLIESGILKHLYGSRTPSKYNSIPTGYFRSGTYTDQLEAMLCPGVVDITSSRGVSNDSLKRILIRTASENGFKYAYIVRKLESQSRYSNGAVVPTYLYKINVADGSEEPVRDAEIKEMRKGILKSVLGTSNKKIVVNTTLSGSFPVSYICPDAILLPDLEIGLRKNIQKTPPAVVLNPLKDKI